jgi:signal transduction histidine kinase
MRSAIDVLGRPELSACDMSRPLDVLSGQLAQASRLTDDLLDASRIAEGKLEIKKVPVEIGAILREVDESTRARHLCQWGLSLARNHHAAGSHLRLRRSSSIGASHPESFE